MIKLNKLVALSILKANMLEILDYETSVLTLWLKK
jgi:hypothetical protein